MSSAVKLKVKILQCIVLPRLGSGSSYDLRYFGLYS